MHACLVAYMANQRRKEIGIRKVMGASPRQIVMLLSADFLRIILLAFCIAVPISWFGIDRWLVAFPFRIDLSLTVFLGAGCSVLLVSLLTMSYQAIAAANGNPIENLRRE